MLDAALQALAIITEPSRLLALFVGMFVGMIVGMLPGLGGIAAISLLLPFLGFFDSYAGLALLLGATSVIYTSDTITSVLIGAPGSAAAAPTAIEGHPLAREGQAARVLTVGFTASVFGGVVGAIVLLLAIPIAGPLVLAMGTPELLMLTLAGLFFASSLIGPQRRYGLMAGAIGLTLGAVGPAPAAAELRFTFGQTYLADGLSLAIVALGLFGLPEIVGMLGQGGSISPVSNRLKGWTTGLLDIWRHRWLMIRSTAIGVLGGFVPAIGASASTWVAYSHAVNSAKDKSRFGKGDIRGVVAAEGANNATAISDLVPTLLFSVPGGPSAAVFLGALFSFGYFPGPRMVTDTPEVLYMIVWSVALGSVIGGLFCFGAAPLIARLTSIRFPLIAAPLLVIIVMGALQSTGTIGDIGVLVGVGLLGWWMKTAGWPRAPALVGFVLAEPLEQYFWLTTQLHGSSWVMRPGVLVIVAIVLGPMAYSAIRQHLRRRNGEIETVPENREDGTADAGPTVLSVLLSAALAAAILPASTYGLVLTLDFYEAARLLPLLALVPMIVLAAYILLRDGILFFRSAHFALPQAQTLRELGLMGALVLYVAGNALVGFFVSSAILLFWLLYRHGRLSLIMTLGYGGLILVCAHFLVRLLRLNPPEGALWRLFGF